MPPSSRNLESIEIEVIRTRASGGGILEGNFLLESAFAAHVDDPALPYLLAFEIAAVDGRLVAESVTVRQRQSSEPVGTEGLRKVPVEAYLARIRQEAADALDTLLMPIRSDSGTFRKMGLVPSSEEKTRIDRAQRRGRPRKESMADVVAAYREALADDKAKMRATEEAADRLGYSRGHVSRVLTQARKEGLLGDARPGQSGERLPAQTPKVKKSTKSTRKRVR